MSLQFLPAGTSDALTLTGISKRSFETDVSVGGPSKGGPPGYMSVPGRAIYATHGRDKLLHLV